jgi:putative endopeptidase
MSNRSLNLTGFLLLAPAFCVMALTPAVKDPAPQAAVIHGIDPANLDKTATPCADFFQYATGGWVARNPIPPDQSRWGTFDALALRNQTDLRSILEAAAKDVAAPKGSIERRLGDFYAVAMDEKRAEELGASPLLPYLERVAAVKDLDGLASEAASLHRAGVRAFFGVGSEQDAKDATKVIAEVHQGGLGLPDRDYYLRDDSKSKAIREAYLKYVAQLLRLEGDSADVAAAGAKTVLRLETALAGVSMSRVERRNPKATYHPMSVGDLEALAPVFPWPLYLKGVGLPSLASLDVGMPEFFKGLSAQLKSEPLADWKTYLRWQVARSLAPYLSAAFVEANFEFSRVMTGAQEDQPRWRKAVAATSGALGEDLGQLYVKAHFSPESKAQALTILHDIRAALKDDLKTLSWMSEPTRKQALIKLSKIEEKIGYPDKWRDYSGLAVDRTSYLGNVVRSNEFEFKRDLDKIGKPLDRTEWHMTPATVNAYYSAQMNEIVFPAGILQPPFFDPKADAAVNYGAIGVVIGHEITHGFDDKGSQYDAEGNLKDWWTEEDGKAFKAKGELIADQASAFVVDGDLHLQGKLVEGEAIADLGGVTLAYRAYQKSLEGKPQPERIDGFTGDQRFFLGFATVWASSIRPQMSRMLATIDSHPPARYRVNGTLADVPAFSQAFLCKPGDALAGAGGKDRQIW